MRGQGRVGSLVELLRASPPVLLGQALRERGEPADVDEAYRPLKVVALRGLEGVAGRAG
jgi:hypothetical protein